MFTPPRIFNRLPVLHRLVPSVLRRYARHVKHRYSVERRLGALFLLDNRNSVDRNLLVRGEWEPRQIKTLRDWIHKTIRPGEASTFLDIGAHGALYAILIALDGLVGRIVAFEPEPTNLAQLRANLFINHLLARIEVVEKAAGAAIGRIPFYLAHEANRGSSRTINSQPETLVGRMEVDVAPIDTMVELADGLVIAKIDVEGSELSVLAGMTQTMARNRCLFQIECFDDRSEALKQFMSETGFELVAKVEFDYFFVKS